MIIRLIRKNRRGGRKPGIFPLCYVCVCVHVYMHLEYFLWRWNVEHERYVGHFVAKLLGKIHGEGSLAAPAAPVGFRVRGALLTSPQKKSCIGFRM